MKIINGSITSPKGFFATGAHIGLKKEKKDLALVSSEVPCVAAGTFTTNVVKAAPVLWDMEIINSNNKVRGIVVNSGNANACTGQKGIEDTKQMAECFAKSIGGNADEILVCSTGVIGVPMPMDKITTGISATAKLLGNNTEDGVLAAQAIMTTDTFMKNIAVEIEVSGCKVTVAGMAKGSGMIHPNMATMLGFVTTDIQISKPLLQKAISDSVRKTYNMVSVDGDTSTNDTYVVLANGLANNSIIETENEDYHIFKEALDYINKKLAIDLARDGEGATKLIEANVKGAKTEEDAIKMAKSVISSSLVKTALFGEDANWGRILCAMGYSGGTFNPFGVDITFKSAKGEISLMENGNPIAFSEEKAAEILSEKDIIINIMLLEGTGSATAWGCDLTYDYVKINGDYRS